MVCSNCGKPMDEAHKFCAYCGTPNSAFATADGAQAHAKQKGCLSQAWHDMFHTVGVFKRIFQIVFLPILMGVVAVLVAFIPYVGGFLCALFALAAFVAGQCGAGYAVEWGREPSLRQGFNMHAPLLRGSSFSLGFLSGAISGLLGLLALLPSAGSFIATLGTAASNAVVSYARYGTTGVAQSLDGFSGVGVAASLLSFVLSLLLAMFCAAAVMHFAVSNRLDSAFSLGAVWKPFRKRFGKLFCASLLPYVVAFVVVLLLGVGLVVALSLMFSFSASTDASLGYSAYDLSDPGVVVFLVLFLLLLVVGLLASVFINMLTYRAVGYWAARYAPEWADEPEDSSLPELPEESVVVEEQEDAVPMTSVIEDGQTTVVSVSAEEDATVASGLDVDCPTQDLETTVSSENDEC